MHIYMLYQYSYGLFYNTCKMLWQVFLKTIQVTFIHVYKHELK